MNRTIQAGPYFPPGTSVGAYVSDNSKRGAGGAPSGSAVATAEVASNGTLTFTGLSSGTEYTAAAQVGGTWRLLDFDTRRDNIVERIDFTDYADGQSPVWSDQDGRPVPTSVASSTELASVATDLTTLTAKTTYEGLSEMDTPIVFPHRGGGGNIAPDGAMESFRYATARGLKVIDVDVYETADGGLVVMHDATVDRTTTSTGNTIDLTIPAVRSLVFDAANTSNFGGAWGDCTVGTFDDVCREFGNRVVIHVEAKTVNAGDLIPGVLAAWGIKPDMVLVSSFISGALTASIAAGYPTMLISSTLDQITPAAAAAAGYDWIAVDYQVWPTSTVAAFQAEDVRVMAFTIDRQVDAAPWITAGVDAIMSDDPFYLIDFHPVRTSPPWATKTYWDGHLITGGQTDRGVWSGTDVWGSEVDENAYRSVLQGWATPKLKELNAAGGTFTIDIPVALGTQNATTGSNAFFEFFLSTWDYQKTTSGTRTGQNGYSGYIRVDGSLRLYRVDNGVTTQLGSALATTAPTLAFGGYITFRLAVTPTSITWTRLDTGQNRTTTDTTYRNLNHLYSARFGLTYRLKKTGASIS